MTSIGLGFYCLVMLILINGLLAMSEMAVVSARHTRLQQRAQEGERRMAMSNPGKTRHSMAW